MCEKPAAGTVDEVDAMIAARDRAELPVLIGFQHIYADATAELKRRLLAGVIGKVQSAVVHGYWPRSNQYFARTDWAGCLKHRGSWVLDSPIQNAMSHYVNLPLFLMGADFASPAQPTSIEAELYRAAPIENYDTISARVQLAGEMSMLVLLTHAAGKRGGPFIRIEGDAGRVTWYPGEGPVIETQAGREPIANEGDGRFNPIQCLGRLMRGRSVEPMALATLECARSHTVLVNGASEASPVVDVPAAAIEQVAGEQNSEPAGEVFHTIRGIEAVFDACAAKGQMLHESGAIRVHPRPGRCDLQGYRHFRGVREGA